MTCDPFDDRCVNCHTALMEPVPFCDDICERKYYERRVRRALAWVTIRAHLRRLFHRPG